MILLEGGPVFLLIYLQPIWISLFWHIFQVTLPNSSMCSRHHLFYMPNLRTGFQKDEHLFKYVLSLQTAWLWLCTLFRVHLSVLWFVFFTDTSLSSLKRTEIHITVQLFALSFRKSVATAESSGLLAMCEIRFVALCDLLRLTFLFVLFTHAKVATWKMSLTLFSDCKAEHSM